MTFEEMMALGEKVAAALRAAGFDSPEVLTEDAKPGDPIPVAFSHEGGDFVVALDAL